MFPGMAGLLSMRNLPVCALLAMVAVLGVDTLAHADSASPSPAKTVKRSVFVDGGVKNPGRYDWFRGMTLRDAFEDAGGLLQANSDRVYVRIIRADGFQILCNLGPGIDPDDKRFPILEGDHIDFLTRQGTSPITPLEPKAAN
jgi:SLBB domain